jgi:phenylacetate-CoA ligase
MTAAATGTAAADSLHVRVGQLLAIDSWSREQVLELQRARLRSLLQHAVARSPYYREHLGPDAVDAPLADLPTLSKARLMDEFDRVVTDPRIRRADVERFLAGAAGQPYLGAFRAFATSGSTGMPGVFVFAEAEFREGIATMLALMARFGIGPSTRVATIGAPSDVHVTRQLFAGVQSGRDALRASVTTPLSELVERLNRFRPDAVLTYPSVMGALADEQLEGRLAIEPRRVAVGSEVLTEDTERRIEAAWGIRPVNVYAATEAVIMAIGFPGAMHVVEHSFVLEVVDADGMPVQPGMPGARVLLTSLLGHVQPLIRYELSDSVVLAEGDDDGGLPYTRIARVDGRSDDVLSLPGTAGGIVAVQPYRLGAPFSALLDVRGYQIVHRRDGSLQVRVVPRRAAPGLRDSVAAAVARALAEAGAVTPVHVELVDEIEREPGPAAKVKVVCVEAARA